MRLQATPWDVPENELKNGTFAYATVKSPSIHLTGVQPGINSCVLLVTFHRYSLVRTTTNTPFRLLT